MPKTTDVEQEASEWIIRSEAEDFTDELKAELGRWLEEPRNHVAFLKIKEAWRWAERVSGTRPLDGKVDKDLLKDSDLLPPEPKKKRGSRWTFRVGIVAALALVIYFLGSTAWVFLGPPEWDSYSTSVGGYEHVTLADGSVIQLNTNSEIRSRLTPEKREIQLIRGEALVKVAHDVRRPFTVKVGSTAVRADPSRRVASSFAVRLREPEGADVSVTDGSVRLGSSYRMIDVVLGRMPASESTLVAGDTATIRPDGIHLTRVGLEELNRKLSWTAGLLSFQGETLAQVAEEFNRYNRRQLLVVDRTIAMRRIGGAFQATDPDSFISALEKWFGIQADEQVPSISGNSVIRLRGEQPKR
jgi:transmembrane sensor